MRQAEILALHDRFGLVTVDWCQALFGCTENAAVKALGRSGLESFPLIHPRRFWARRPLGPQALPVAFAVGCYCVTRPRDAESAELPGQLFSAAGETLVTGAVTEAIRVDLGGSADHLCRKARRFLRLNKGLDLSSLTYVLLTATPEKAEAIRKSLQKHTWPFALKVVVVDDLLFLLTR